MASKIKLPAKSNIKKVIIIISGEIEHFKGIIEAIQEIERTIKITCVVQKEFEKVIMTDDRISKIITLEKLGDYSFKFSLRALAQIRRDEYDLAISMARAGNELRDRRTHLLTYIIKANHKIISTSDGSFREFKFHFPMANLFEVLISNIISIMDIILAKLIRILLALLLPLLKFLKKHSY